MYLKQKTIQRFMLISWFYVVFKGDRAAEIVGYKTQYQLFITITDGTHKELSSLVLKQVMMPM